MLNTAQAWLAALGWEKKVLFYAGALSLVPVLALTLSGAPDVTAAKNAPPEVDTLIPKGFVLVPIEVQNYEALDSILGRFGVVDLFRSAGTEGHRPGLVARNVRILRAPQNPTHFAILIAEDQAGPILKDGGTFSVVVKRPAEVGTEFVKSEAKRKRKIIFGGD